LYEYSSAMLLSRVTELYKWEKATLKTLKDDLDGVKENLTQLSGKVDTILELLLKLQKPQ
jgi:hypothetical protein